MMRCCGCGCGRCFARCVCSCAVFRSIVEHNRGDQPRVWFLVQFICARYMRCVFLGRVRDGGLGDVSVCCAMVCFCFVWTMGVALLGICCVAAALGYLSVCNAFWRK